MSRDSLLNANFIHQLRAAYERGYRKCAEELGQLKPYISLSDAYRAYGRATVDRWAKEGLIEIIKDGTNSSKCRIHRETIEIVASMSNRESWWNNISTDLTCD